MEIWLKHSASAALFVIKYKYHLITFWSACQTDMNVTVTSLFLGSLATSPFISGGPRMVAQSYLFKEITARRFASSFAYQTGSTTFSHCKFSEFLDSAIRLTSAMSYTRERIDKQVSAQGFDVTVTDCVFEVHSSMSGGAINVYGKVLRLRVERSGFHRCDAAEGGGAISFFGSRMDIRYSCFNTCESGDVGMAVETVLFNDKGAANLMGLSLKSCGDPYGSSGGRFGALYFVFGKVDGRVLNSSDNSTPKGGSFLGLEEVKMVDIRTAYVEECEGRSLFAMFRVAKDCSYLDMISIVNCGSSANSEDFTLFALPGSHARLINSVMFGTHPTYIATDGILAFKSVTTDLSEMPKVLNGTFTETSPIYDASFRPLLVSYVDTNVCFALGSHTVPATWVLPKMPILNSGIIHFLLIAVLVGVLVAAYWAFERKNHRGRKSDDMEDVKFLSR